MKTLRWALVLQVLAFWPVGQWYVVKAIDTRNEPWGLIALVAALALALRKPLDTDRAALTPAQVRRSVWLAAAGVGVYLTARPFAPDLILAVVALGALAVTAGALRGGMRREPALWGLLVLALPDISTLQYYVGYPLRIAVGAIAAPLLRVLGADVTRVGTVLQTPEQAVWIDAPCSGVWMLWGALLLTLILAGLRRLNLRATCIALTGALALVLAGNLLRTLAAFLLETQALVWRGHTLPAWTHEGMGLVVFALLVAALLRGMTWIERRFPAEGRTQRSVEASP